MTYDEVAELRRSGKLPYGQVPLLEVPNQPSAGPLRSRPSRVHSLMHRTCTHMHAHARTCTHMHAHAWRFPTRLGAPLPFRSARFHTHTHTRAHTPMACWHAGQSAAILRWAGRQAGLYPEALQLQVPRKPADQPGARSLYIAVDSGRATHEQMWCQGRLPLLPHTKMCFRTLADRDGGSSRAAQPDGLPLPPRCDPVTGACRRVRRLTGRRKRWRTSRNHFAQSGTRTCSPETRATP